jgi:hypothetical protein
MALYQQLTIKIPKQTEPGNLAVEPGIFVRGNRENRAIMSGIRELTGKSALLLATLVQTQGSSLL